MEVEASPGAALKPMTSGSWKISLPAYLPSKGDSGMFHGVFPETPQQIEPQLLETVSCL